MWNSLRAFSVEFKDILYREPKLIWRYYRPFSFAQKKKGRYVFMVDGRVGHGGMFDRLKGIISVYAISKVQGKDFRINFVYPFCLEKYLEPNQYDWRISHQELIYSFPSSRPLFLYGECYHPRRLFKNRQSESHFYFGYNILDEINKRYGTSFEWGGVYGELFKPSSYLQKYIDVYKQEIGKDYIVIHTRFLNLLGDKVETSNNPELPDEGKKQLMMKMYRKILELRSLHQASSPLSTRIMLASDSMSFIDYIKELMPDIYVVPGTVKHIDTAGHTDNQENIKMFLDYYLIAGAKKVYNIVSEGMWPSAFSEYAAKIGGVSFVRIEV